MSDGTGMFNMPADAYERYMGLWSRPLARELVAAAGIDPGTRVLDVGCGTGALTTELARRVGAERVAAVDPLPFGDGAFDAALCQLVVNFMSDAHTGVGEMRRVTRPGGTVAACTWDYRTG